MMETSRAFPCKKKLYPYNKRAGLQHDAHKGIKEGETYDTNNIKSNNAIPA